MFTDQFKAQPFWWDTTPRLQLDNQPLPSSVDVLIIGAGYTGMTAAIQTARGGRSTLVLDAHTVGWGCSSRNGGQVSDSLKPDFTALAEKVGPEAAYSILNEGVNALEFIETFIRGEGMDCDWQRSGRFVGAHNKRAFRRLERMVEQGGPGPDIPSRIVLPQDTASEAGTNYYHGGCVIPSIAALHPGKFMTELVRVARQDGVQIREHCAVSGINRHRDGFTVHTAQGTLRVRDVLVATNGYTDRLFPQLRRRVIPIGSYMIATERIAPELMQQLMPRQRMMVDTRKLVYYYRACPEGERVLFGGRVALGESDPKKCAPKLHRSMCQIFPQLQTTKVSHAWMGFVAYTFDEMPHLGQLDGVYYAMGYCGSGISLSTYFGKKIGQQMLGHREGDSPLSNVSFPTRPYYTGKPWFLAPSILYYQLQDRLPL